MKLFDDIMYFLFPANCDVCGRILSDGEEVMCSYCYLGLPRTNFHKDENNAVAQLFWGRVKVERAASFFFFNKGSEYQKLLHKLKYQARGDIGVYLGKIYAAEIMDTEFTSVDLIVPVPLHPRKQRRRGYNQSMKIAEGISGLTKITIESDNLRRIEFTDTQTRRNRFDRFLNMQDKFVIINPEAFQGKRVLLVDDVVTTGATVEACVGVLLEAGGVGVYVVTVAMA
jgi:ComF family protein